AIGCFDNDGRNALALCGSHRTHPALRFIFRSGSLDDLLGKSFSSPRSDVFLGTQGQKKSKPENPSELLHSTCPSKRRRLWCDAEKHGNLFVSCTRCDWSDGYSENQSRFQFGRNDQTRIWLPRSLP